MLPFFLEHLAQFIPVCGDELLFQLGSFELNGNMITVGGNETVASLEACDVGDLRICEFQGVLNANGLIILKVQDDFCFGIIDDTLTILTAFKGKEVIQVLGSCNGSAAIATAVETVGSICALLAAGPLMKMLLDTVGG